MGEGVRAGFVDLYMHAGAEAGLAGGEGEEAIREGVECRVTGVGEHGKCSVFSVQCSVLIRASLRRLLQGGVWRGGSRYCPRGGV